MVAPVYVDGVMLAAALVLCSGACLLMVAPIFLLLSFGDQRQVRTVRRITPSAIGSRTVGRVAVEDVTEYGAAGRQAGPASGEDCAWHRATLIRVLLPHRDQVNSAR